MANRHPLGFAPGSVWLEAEVHKHKQSEFSQRYLTATGEFVCPGDPLQYQDQPNKWGAELRIYFNMDEDDLSSLRSKYSVEEKRGYLSNRFQYRINDNNLWWQLVEDYGYRLGPN